MALNGGRTNRVVVQSAEKANHDDATFGPRYVSWGPIKSNSFSSLKKKPSDLEYSMATANERFRKAGRALRKRDRWRHGGQWMACPTFVTWSNVTDGVRPMTNVGAASRDHVTVRGATGPRPSEMRITGERPADWVTFPSLSTLGWISENNLASRIKTRLTR